MALRQPMARTQRSSATRNGTRAHSTAEMLSRDSSPDVLGARPLTDDLVSYLGSMDVRLLEYLEADTSSRRAPSATSTATRSPSFRKSSPRCRGVPRQPPATIWAPTSRASDHESSLGDRVKQPVRGWGAGRESQRRSGADRVADSGLVQRIGGWRTRRPEGLGDGVHERGGRAELAAMAGEEVRDAAREGELRDEEVEVHPVDALEDDVLERTSEALRGRFMTAPVDGGP